MTKSRRVLIIVALIAVLILVAGIILALRDSNNSKLPSAGNSQPPQAAVRVTSVYLQAREDSVGFDQSSPTSWLNTVKSITTPAWFARLQPNPDTPTTNVPGDYRLAHSHHFKVRADVSNCVWDRQIAVPTSSSGTMSCSIYDNTINAATGTIVPLASLPFGWAHNGQQLPAIISLVKQNGTWLVGLDTSGQGQ